MATSKLPKAKKAFDDPFLVKLTDTQLETIEAWIGTRLEDCLTAHADRDENIKRYRTLYQAKDWERDLPFEKASNLHIPMTGWIVDALHVRLVQSHFGVKPYVRCQPQESSDQETAQTVQNLLWYVHNAQNALLPSYLAILDSLIAGFGVIKEPWGQKWQRITEKKKPRFALRYNLPQKEYIRSEDFYVYPSSADSVDSAQFVGHRFYRRYDDLVRDICTGIYNEDWVKNLEGKSVKKPEDDRQTDAGTREAGIDWKDLPYELFELIVSYDLDGDGLEEDYLCVFERQTKTLLRWVNYPYAYGERFYHVYTPFPNGTVYGDSLVLLLENLEEELSTLHNQRIDNNSFVNTPVFTVLEGSPASKDDEKWSPGQKIIVADHDDIRQLTTIPPRDGFGSDEDRIMSYAKLRSGVSELNAGQMPKGEKTAYEVEAALAEGSIKIRLIVSLGTGWLTRNAWQEIAMLKQFLPDEDFTRITNKPNFLADLKYEDLWKQFDFEPVGNTTTSNKELERQKFTYIREALKGDPLVTGIDPITGQQVDRTLLGNWWELDKQWLLANDIQEYIPIIGEKPEPPQEMEVPGGLAELGATTTQPIVPGQQPGGGGVEDLVAGALQGLI